MDTAGLNVEAGLEIRPMESCDAQEVSLLVRQLGYQRPVDAVVHWIETIGAKEKGQAAFVACWRGEVVGWIEVSIEHRLQTPPFALIGGLVVKDGVRGLGIGKRLCEQAEAWTWQRQMDTLRVTSRSARRDAHRFYLRDGYRQVKTSLVFEKKRPE